jgi:hypothetical protein
MTEPLQVMLFEAKPNAMFTAAQTRCIRFLRFSRSVPCAECGKRTKHHWTALYSFKALSMTMIVAKESDKVHAPLAAVCRSHLLKPVEWKQP